MWRPNLQKNISNLVVISLLLNCMKVILLFSIISEHWVWHKSTNLAYIIWPLTECVGIGNKQLCDGKMYSYCSLEPYQRKIDRSILYCVAYLWLSVNHSRALNVLYNLIFYEYSDTKCFDLYIAINLTSQFLVHVYTWMQSFIHIVRVFFLCVLSNCYWHLLHLFLQTLYPLHTVFYVLFLVCVCVNSILWIRVMHQSFFVMITSLAKLF